MTALVELCCGGAAVSLRLLGGPGACPPVGYMGGKRHYAGAILGALGLRHGERIDRVMLVDVGPWGRAWACLTERGGPARVAAELRRWAARGEKGVALFDRILSEGQDEQSEAVWTAQFLALQCGSAKGLPVGADPGVNAAWRTSGYGHTSKGGVARGFIERLRPGHLAARVERLASIRWPAATLVLCRDVRDVEPVPGAVVYVDPNYAGTTGYGDHDISRDEVLVLANRWVDAGCVVAVSEREPLPLGEWSHIEITGEHCGQPRTFTRSRTEFLTISRPPVRLPSMQTSLALDGAA